MHPLAVDDRARPAEIRQVHQDAAEVLRQRADRLVKRNPRSGAGTVGVEEQHRLALAHIVVVHIHAPWHAAHRDRLAGALLGKAIRRDKRHVVLLVAAARLDGTSRPRPRSLLPCGAVDKITRLLYTQSHEGIPLRFWKCRLTASLWPPRPDLDLIKQVEQEPILREQKLALVSHSFGRAPEPVSCEVSRKRFRSSAALHNVLQDPSHSSGNRLLPQAQRPR